MLWGLIRKEILSHLLTLRCAVTFVLFLGLILASFFVNVHEFKREQALYAAQARGYHDAIQEMLGEENKGWGTYWRIFYNEGRLDALPPPSMIWAGQGLHPTTPKGVNTRAGFTSYNIDRATGQDELKGMMTTPDFIYVVNVVLSLLAILFMFDAICGEKEAGTLRLMLTTGAPRHTILLGKWIGGYTVLMIPFAIAVFGGCVYAWHAQALDATNETVTRLTILLVLAALYIAVFFNLSLFVSCTTGKSATSLLICLLLWVGFILVMPNLAPVTAKILAPTPSLEKIEEEKRAIDREVRLQLRRLQLLSGGLEYGESAEQQEKDLEREGERRKGRFDQYYEGRRMAQIKLAQTLGRISPSPCWVFAGVAITDTGLAYRERIRNARKRLMREYDEFARDFRDRWQNSPDRNPKKEWPRLEQNDLPSLRVRPGGLNEAMQASLDDVLILAVLNVLFFMLAFVFFLRYDAR